MGDGYFARIMNVFATASVVRMDIILREKMKAALFTHTEDVKIELQ